MNDPVNSLPDIRIFISIATLIGGVVGALISGFFLLWIARGNRESLAKTEARKMAIMAGLENWRHQNELAISLVKEGKASNAIIGPPDAYIVHMLRIMEIAGDTEVTNYEAANRVVKWSSGEFESDGAKKGPA